MQAVIRTGGKQYVVKPGDVIDVELLNSEDGSNVEFDDVLLVSDEGSDVKVGSPTVEGAKVTGKVLGTKKGKKIIVFKFRRRKGFKKKQGHRQKYSSVEITDIQA
ncbi:MAG: 50S ribosomal protein L21 [Candidatus Dadabacteria bacterium]|nr:50S ribosomal protein L21 [Candidatus Dadabacteria bacterium]NIS08938.1 50S ribosomal protein L21 [Candidatus Dadabacteria bacterium]NIV40840.1 50S ribosomal protein L21 [Candidatus Dadabacteria bacterium]NIX15488.1 50S ribosomal protein L21 [Candidatus Dadabacteria bacterium]NIY22809.1 50S ribosomal protein L21 [Candidatus Dadabacteria bacterium]